MSGETVLICCHLFSDHFEYETWLRLVMGTYFEMFQSIMIIMQCAQLWNNFSFNFHIFVVNVTRSLIPYEKFHDRLFKRCVSKRCTEASFRFSFLSNICIICFSFFISLTRNCNNLAILFTVQRLPVSMDTGIFIWNAVNLIARLAHWVQCHIDQ